MTRSLITLERGRLAAGRYRLLRPLGSGGSAYVWAARDESLGRDVAIKVLSGTTTQGGHERERLQREARLLATLDHPRITTVFDFAEITEPNGENYPFLVTELLDGEGLDARLGRGPLPTEDALSVCAQVADALAAAHEAGVVHRDVKPGNVMLSADGAKLLDFGISRREADTDLTGQVLIGTPACMAPEQWRVGNVEPASDVYALGCLLYWCLSGHGPFSGHELTALGMAHLLADPPALPDTGPHRAAIDEIYEACMRKDPAERPRAAEVAAVLENPAQSQTPLRSTTTAATLRARRPGTTVPHRLSRRAQLAAYGASAGVMLVVSLVLTLALADGSPAGQASTGSGAVQSRSSAPSTPATTDRISPAASPATSSGGNAAAPQQTATKTKNGNSGHHRGHGDGDASTSIS